MSKPTCLDTFCVLPWLHRFTNIGGEIQVCCTSEESDNNVRDDDGNTLNASQKLDDEKIMNSLFMKNLRLKMMKNEWPDLCFRCKVTEESGGISRRISENLRHQREIHQLLGEIAPDGGIPLRLRSIDYRLGNQCNLACRMCNPRASSRWIGEWRKVHQSLFVMSDSQEREYRNYDWYQSPHLVTQLRAALPSLTSMHFAGGEPLIIPEMLTLLKECVDSGYAGNIDLSYNTNLTYLPPAIKTLWPHFRKVRLLCSVDAFGPVNEFIRYPSKWKVIDRNLRDIDAHFQEYGVTEVNIMCTVQVYNVFKLGELFDYVAENFKWICPIPHLVDLHYPDYYRTQILPPELKSQARAHLMETAERTQKRLEKGSIHATHGFLLDSLRGSLNFLSMEDLQHRIPAFMHASSSKDANRRQRLFDVIPELAPLAGQT